MPSYKLGRRPGQIPSGLRDLTYYAAGPLPRPPAKVAVPKVANWDMDGNDQFGDCGVAAINHGFMAAAAATRERETFPSADDVVSYYFDYTGGDDTGVVLSDFLAYVRQNGFCGHTVGAYAPVSIQDIPTLQFAIDAYDVAYVGISVTQAMMDAAQGSPPWTWTQEDTAGDTIGGHCIILAGYDSSWLYGVTWGNVVRIAYPAWHQMAEEAWAAIDGELVRAHGDGRGISLAALTADLAKVAS